MDLRDGLEGFVGPGTPSRQRLKLHVGGDEVEAGAELMALQWRDSGGIVVDRGGVVGSCDKGVSTGNSHGILVRQAETDRQEGAHPKCRKGQDEREWSHSVGISHDLRGWVAMTRVIMGEDNINPYKPCLQ